MNFDLWSRYMKKKKKQLKNDRNNIFYARYLSVKQWLVISIRGCGINYQGYEKSDFNQI